jgi:methylenetetrahydrofolate reductase (NADPH)
MPAPQPPAPTSPHVAPQLAMAGGDTPKAGPSDTNREINDIAAELVANGSLEMGADSPQDARRIAELLPAGTLVYVNHLPRSPLAHVLPALIALNEAGLEPVPHVAARRLADRQEAKTFFEQAVRHAGVRKVLLIGGDLPQPVGPFADAAALLREGLLAGSGLQQVGLAGYPEGHPRIPSARIADALAEKLALATTAGLSPYVVTQFSFAPARIAEYCVDLARRAPGVPVYVGLAGPTNPVTLLRYAQRCGVSASLRALQAEGMRAVRLFTHVDPTEQLIALARHARAGSASNVVGVHLYSFGGVAATAAWINARITARRG